MIENDRVRECDIVGERETEGWIKKASSTGSTIHKGLNSVCWFKKNAISYEHSTRK